jgi:hypothetical protein
MLARPDTWYPIGPCTVCAHPLVCAPVAPGVLRVRHGEGGPTALFYATPGLRTVLWYDGDGRSAGAWCRLIHTAEGDAPCPPPTP